MTGPGPLLELGALAAAYAAGRTTPTAVARQVLARIEEVGGDDQTIWIARVPPEELLARAAALEDGPRDLPLYGIPFAVKDNVDVAGMPTTAGCPAFEHTPGQSATAVRRLLAAGALLVGKNNLDQLATGLTGTRSPYGTGESVYGHRLVPGGSSSGSALAVATGQVAFALATDTAGSGRVPAALNGIVGLKPTPGLVSAAGVVPACRSLDCVSLLAGSVGDAMAVLAVVAGPDPADPFSRRISPAPARPAATLRLGLPPLEALGIDDPELRRLHRAARARASATAGEVVEVPAEPFLAAGRLLYDGPWIAERLAGLEGFLHAHAEGVQPLTRQILDSGRGYSAVEAFRAQHRLRALQAEVERLFDAVDAVLLPTIDVTPTLEEVAADPLGRNAALGRWTHCANLLGLAALSVPAGTTPGGRPCGSMLYGPAGSEALLAALGAALTGEPEATGRQAGPPATGERGGPVLLAVVGHHLSGQPRNAELTARGAVLVETTTTAPAYRLYRLGSDGAAVPGLVRVPGGGERVEVEVWSLPPERIGGLLTGVRAPLGLGWVRLAGGREVLGFLCEAYAVGEGAADITASGGWRRHITDSTTATAADPNGTRP